MNHRDLISTIKQNKILPLYLLCGEEVFLIQEALDLIIQAVIEPTAKDFNLSIVYCRETSGAEVVNLAQTLPFMSQKRLVIAKDIDALKAADIEELVSYLKDPSPSTCLVMVSTLVKFEKKPVISAVEAHGAVVRYYPMLDREITSWIENWVRTRGLSIQHYATQYLWQITGNDLQKIANELDKVLIFVKEKKTITFNDVKTVVGDFREFSPFDLAAALGQKDREKALMILTRLLQEGEAPVGLLGSIAWNFRRLLQAKAMEADGLELNEIMKKLRVIFHQTKLFKEEMERYTLDELREVFVVMLSADRALKTSGLHGRLVLERMILQLCEQIVDK